jgi:hypothetical protein
MKYEILLNILDTIRSETSSKHQSKYSPPINEVERIGNARARAFIHLYLKVMFGILDFDDRERNITDGSYDGGIDGYHIDTETKQIYLIQSKFRATSKNFQNKEITLEELLRMDINRILEGEECDENGNSYNGKIKQLQREISSLSDVARYSYKIIVLANLFGVSPAKLRQLTGGYAVEVFDFEKSYEKLVFPVISGTYFTASDISIPINLSNKNAGSKISYTVKTKISDCEITVLFAPTIEIAKVMSKYKNSVLKYNPRSYLDLEGQSVNNAIRETILKTETNEFALYNNGITMLSDETYINEKIGQKNKAQLRVKNPQIINGGQTSYTLSRIYEEQRHGDPEALFQEKEVLLKIITLIDNNSHESKLQLIDEISNATNKQTPVINADRFANEIFHQKVQKRVFDRYGLLYERKRGEFSDGLRSGYLNASQVIERNLFLRLFYSANGKINKGVQKKLFQKNNFPDINLNDDSSFDNFYLGFHVYRRLIKDKKPTKNSEKTIYAKVFAYNQLFMLSGLLTEPSTIDANIKAMEVKWADFIMTRRETSTHGIRKYLDRRTGEMVERFSETKYFRSGVFEKDIAAFFRASVP